MAHAPKHFPVGDRALAVKFGNSIRLSLNLRVHALKNAIQKAKLRNVEECVPTYCTLLVYYVPLKTTYEKLVFRLKDLEEQIDEHVASAPHNVIQIPVIYGGEYGPDLNYVSQYSGLSQKEVVKLHCGSEYIVFMIGFVAGFPYLGKVAKKIAAPKLRSPRLHVPAGSVGIAERQTGIYPCESPGGWRIVGRTPLKLFDVKKDPPALIRPGEIVKFRPIGKREFKALS